MQHLSGIWADVLVWAIILTGWVVCAGVLTRRDRSHRLAPPVTTGSAIGGSGRGIAAAENPQRLGPEREWALVMRYASRNLERGAALAGLQADAALKLAAAEHAINRLLADYARLCQPGAGPAVAPTHRPAHAHGILPYAPKGTTPERRRLAA